VEVRSVCLGNRGFGSWPRGPLDARDTVPRRKAGTPFPFGAWNVVDASKSTLPPEGVGVWAAGSAVVVRVDTRILPTGGSAGNVVAHSAQRAARPGWRRQTPQLGKGVRLPRCPRRREESRGEAAFRRPFRALPPLCVVAYRSSLLPARLHMDRRQFRSGPRWCP